MKCPYCSHPEQRVLDSRPARDGEAIRRRRECEGCGRRFTTYEAPEAPRLLVVKRSGVREEFDRDKLLSGMVTACRKRPVAIEALREAAERVESDLFDLCDSEVPSSAVGDRALLELARLDQVAFVRFASVYREFESPQEFAETVRRLQPRARGASPARTAVLTSVDR